LPGVKHWLWRAVDQAGVVLDVLVQRRRNKQAAKRLLRKLLKRQMRPPRVMITDKLASYGAAKREVMPGVEHRQHKGLNNRAENSHQPTRRRERQMKQFKSAGQAQRFLSAHDQINNLFHLRRDQVNSSNRRHCVVISGMPVGPELLALQPRDYGPFPYTLIERLLAELTTPGSVLTCIRRNKTDRVGEVQVRNVARERLEKGEMSLGAGVRTSPR
jgi:hypothetical protein